MSNEQPIFEIRRAETTSIIPMVSFYGESATGKTLSALLYARGIVGPKGRIGVVDTENKRASIFAKLVPGGFDVIDLTEPFTPGRYQAAIDQLEQACDITVVDSMSHEWEGPGGVLEWQEEELWNMAKDDYGKQQSMKLLSWQKPKRAHKALLQWMLRSTKPLILCFRAERKTHFDDKPEQGKKKSVTTDEFTTPIGAKAFVWECLVTYETIKREVDGRFEGGFTIPRKWTHPDVRALLPGENDQIGIKHGEALAAWCSRQATAQKAAMTSTTPAGSKAPPERRQVLLGELRDATVNVHKWKKADGAAAWPLAKQKLQQFLADECAIDKPIDSQSEDELQSTIAVVKQKLGI